MDLDGWLNSRALIRIDGFTTKPTIAWTAGVRVEDDNLPPKAMAQAGEYIFTAACKPTAGVRGQIFVYRITDRSLLRLISAPRRSRRAPARSISAMACAPDYLTHGDNLRAKVIIHRWKPKG